MFGVYYGNKGGNQEASKSNWRIDPVALDFGWARTSDSGRVRRLHYTLRKLKREIVNKQCRSSPHWMTMKGQADWNLPLFRIYTHVGCLLVWLVVRTLFGNQWRNQQRKCWSNVSTRTTPTKINYFMFWQPTSLFGYAIAGILTCETPSMHLLGYVDDCLASL